MDLLPNILKGLRDDDLVVMEREAKDYALSKGICFRLRSSEDTISLAPITLFPSSFYRKDYDLSKRLQTIINSLTHKMAYNQTFLTECLEKTREVDDFTDNLFGIYTHVLREGLAQSHSLGLLRADYMMNECTDGSHDLKQIEVNNISSSFGGLAPVVRQTHRHILSKYTDIDDLDNRLPENRAPELMAEGLIKAFDIYNRPKAVILVVIESLVTNIFDQRVLEFSVSDSRPDIQIIRRSFADMRENATLNGNRELIVDNRHEVAVVYYRTAYAPQDYSGKEDWDVRLLLERSKAIKCPSIQYHLSGCKKIQQIIANQSVLEKFITNPRDLKDLMQVFTGLWGLEFDQSGDKAIEMALNDPNRFVLKPQREGGGNNYFGKGVALKLDEIKLSKERESYILMELIRAPKVLNHILIANKSVAQNQFRPNDILCEFGVFGAVIGDDNQIVHNREVGHLVKTKLFGSNEAGIAAGFGALDSPFLC